MSSMLKTDFYTAWKCQRTQLSELTNCSIRCSNELNSVQLVAIDYQVPVADLEGGRAGSAPPHLGDGPTPSLYS